VGIAYETIKRDLKKKIFEKTWLVGIKIPSSRELAAVYNCSINTIEKVLKELQRDGFLHREERRGTFVTEKAIPQESPSGSINFDSVATVVDDVNSYIFSKAFRGIEDTLKTRGLGLIISSHDNDIYKQQRILEDLITKGVRGIILYPALAYENDLSYYKGLESLLENIKIVCMDRYIYNSHIPIPYVSSDNFYSSYQVTQHLINNGHRKIAFVRNCNVSTVIERKMGFQQALYDNGIPFRNEMDILLHVSNEELPDFPTEWLRDRFDTQNPTAFFATNYNIAGHLLTGIGKLGLSIPEDVSLVSYEVEYMNNFMPMKITGIIQRFYEMGKAAAQIMLNLLNDKPDYDINGYICRSIISPGETVKRINENPDS
jgi:DNA-binding LacI/PurR family transcriptional regulator